MLATRSTAAATLWTDSQADADLLADLRAAYRGRFDVQDALWWRAHPGVPTPAGVPDPAAELEALSAAVYSRRSTSDPLVEFVDPVSNRTVRGTENGRRLRMLALDLEEDAIALDRAMETVSRLRAAPSRGVQPRGAELFAPGPSALGPSRPSSRRVTPARWLLAALGVTVLALAGIGLATAIPEPTGSDSAGAGAGAGAGALQIFTDHVRYPVIVAPELGDRFNRDSVRSVTPPGAREAGYDFYVAQNTDGDFCLVLEGHNRILDTRCASAGEIASSGLRLDAIVIPPPSPVERSGVPTPVDATVIWTTEGEFTASFTPRARPHER